MAKNVMIKRVEETLRMENAKIIWTNFAGVKGRYNQPGIRNFHLVIDDEELAQRLISDGWNLKRFKPRDDEDLASLGYHMQVAVNFEGRKPPKIILVTEEAQTFLNEHTVELLDSADIISCDIEVNPSNWIRPDGSHGVKGYLKTLYVEIVKDPFADKYKHLPLSSSNDENLDVQEKDD